MRERVPVSGCAPKAMGREPQRPADSKDLLVAVPKIDAKITYLRRPLAAKTASIITTTANAVKWTTAT